MRILVVIKKTQTTRQGDYHIYSMLKMITLETDQTGSQAKHSEIT